MRNETILDFLRAFHTVRKQLTDLQRVATFCGEILADDIRCGDPLPPEDDPRAAALAAAVGGIFLDAATCKPCWSRILRALDGRPTEDA